MGWSRCTWIVGSANVSWDESVQVYLLPMLPIYATSIEESVKLMILNKGWTGVLVTSDVSPIRIAMATNDGTIVHETVVSSCLIGSKAT